MYKATPVPGAQNWECCPRLRPQVSKVKCERGFIKQDANNWRCKNVMDVATCYEFRQYQIVTDPKVAKNGFMKFYCILSNTYDTAVRAHIPTSRIPSLAVTWSRATQ